MSNSCSCRNAVSAINRYGRTRHPTRWRTGRRSAHVHPHMLRHSGGHMLADLGTDTRAIQDHLGHRNIQHTVRYTQLSQQRLANVRIR